VSLLIILKRLVFDAGYILKVNASRFSEINSNSCIPAGMTEHKIFSRAILVKRLVTPIEPTFIGVIFSSGHGFSRAEKDMDNRGL
jgi:hypothetical protein